MLIALPANFSSFADDVVVVAIAFAAAVGVVAVVFKLM